jgi:signal transduction histidine kinase/DNA-binding response OmpR family regulator
LWIGSYSGGLTKFNIKENKFKTFKNDPNNKGSISNNHIISIIEAVDDPNILWVGTYGGGLNRFDKTKETFTNYRPIKGEENSLSSEGIYALYQSPEDPGTLWIGTSEGGLNKLELKTWKFSHFTSLNGLTNQIVEVIEDNSGNLWIITKKGLSFFNTKTNKIRNYDEQDGLFNLSGELCKDSKGRIYIAGKNCITSFYPQEINDNPNIPPVVITDFKVFNSSVPIYKNDNISEQKEDQLFLQKSITESESIELSYEHNFFSFDFAALDFFIPGKNQYAYKMEGFDKDWSYSENRNYAAYTNIPPGEYIFRVKGSNNDYVWNESGVSLKIIIHPPWWKTWWAYILFSLSLLGILSGSARFYLNRQRLKHQLLLEHEYAGKQQEISLMKSRFFTNISHEFRTPLTLIIGPSEKILSSNSENETGRMAFLIRKNALKLLRLINQLLDISKLDEGKLKLKVTRNNLVPFTRGIVMLFESFVETNDIALSVKCEKNDVELYFDQEKMEKILTNIVSNACKFTPNGGRIDILITQSEGKVFIKVRDTGRGISSSEIPKLFDRFYQVDSSHTREYEGAGIGLALTKDLVELHQGKICVQSEEGKWTEFTIEMLTGKDHFKAEDIADEDYTDNYQTSDNLDLYREKSPVIAEQLETAKNEKPILLIVEDNPDVREYIRNSLGDEFNFAEAANGEQGLLKAVKLIPDLIISDIMMPKMDGYELTKHLKTDEKTNHIPVILLTAKSNLDSKIEGLDVGADDYLIKPFECTELKIRINNLINTRKLLQEKLLRGEKIHLRNNEKKLSEINERFLAKLVEIIKKHISEEEFSIEEFAEEAGMSRTQLHRKVKAVTGKSASRYVRSYRLAEAKKLIEENKGNISETAYTVGFSSPVYFSKCFKEEFGYPPSETVHKNI